MTHHPHRAKTNWLSRTLDDEYENRGLIRPTQFHRLAASRRLVPDQWEVVEFHWHGAKVRGHRKLP